MLKSLFISFALIGIACSGNNPTIALEPEPGLTITLSSLKFNSSQKRYTGVVTINNQGTTFTRVSNQELFLYNGKDSTRTRVSLKGSWQIDDGLINIMAGKSLTVQTYWELEQNTRSDTLYAKYVRHLERNTTE